jgi:hypothetical protein
LYQATTRQVICAEEQELVINYIMATQQTIRDNLRSELKIDPNGRVWGDTVLNRNINIARRKIQQDGNYDWHFNDGEGLVPSVISQGEYDLPANFVRLEGIKFGTVNLIPTTKKILKERNSTLSVDGTPQYYYLLGSKFGAWHRPSTIGNFDLTYRSALSSFSADADIETMPDAFVEAIVQYGAYLTWNDVQGREDKAIQAMQNYKEIMEGLYAQYLGRRDDNNFNWSFEVI